MSVVLDAASKVHQKQLDAAARSEDLVLKAISKVNELTAGLRAKAPSVPEQVSGPVEKAAAPLHKVVGSRSELKAYVATSTRDWLEVQQSFQRALVHAVTGSALSSRSDASA